MQRHFIANKETHTPCGLPRTARYVNTLESLRANPSTLFGIQMCQTCQTVWDAVEAALMTLRKIETNVDGLEAQTEMVMRLAFQGIAEEDREKVCEALTWLEHLRKMTTEQAVQMLAQRFTQIIESI